VVLVNPKVLLLQYLLLNIFKCDLVLSNETKWNGRKSLSNHLWFFWIYDSSCVWRYFGIWVILKSTGNTIEPQKALKSWAMVGHACNPSYSGGWRSRGSQFEASLGK
jgi:hypothetical protein